MLAYDRVTDTIRHVVEVDEGFITTSGEVRPRRYIVAPPPQWAIEEHAAREAADFADERDTQRCAIV